MVALLMDGNRVNASDVRELSEGLEACSIVVFDLFDTSITLTMRKEARKGTENKYWSAYSRVGGSLRKCYIGKEIDVEGILKAYNKMIGAMVWARKWTGGGLVGW